MVIILLNLCSAGLCHLNGLHATYSKYFLCYSYLKKSMSDLSCEFYKEIRILLCHCSDAFKILQKIYRESITNTPIWLIQIVHIIIGSKLASCSSFSDKNDKNDDKSVENWVVKSLIEVNESTLDVMGIKRLVLNPKKAHQCVVRVCQRTILLGHTAAFMIENNLRLISITFRRQKIRR